MEVAADAGGAAWTLIVYSRPLVTDDLYDIPVEDRTIFLLWAYGATGSVNEAACTFTRHADRDFVLTNFLPAGGETATRDELLARLAQWRNARLRRSQAQLARPVAEADIFAKNATVPVCGQQP